MINKQSRTVRKGFQNSPFLHLFENNGIFCLLHCLTLEKIYGGKILSDAYNLFKQNCPLNEARANLASDYPVKNVNKIITDLTTNAMIVSDYHKDLDTYFNRYTQGVNLYQIRHMYFIATTGCNLRCRYCFIEDDARSFSPSSMTIETAKKGLEIFAKLSEGVDKISLTFYGGEPLLNCEVLFFAMRYVRELESSGDFTKPVDMTLLTNGVLIDDETIKTVLETKTKVSISIDGPQELHDACRINTGGNGSFSQVYDGYKKMRDAGVSPGVSCTLNSMTINEMETVVRFITEDLQPSGMGFNLLLPTINGGNPFDVSFEHATKQLIYAFKILREKGIYEDRVMRRVTPYTECGFHFKDCMGVGGQIVLTPEGRIGPCQAFLGLNEYFPLSVDALYEKKAGLNSADDIYTNSLFNEWRYRLPLNMKKCMDCFAIAVCGGGCPYASYVNHGSIWEVDERICYQAKQILEWMIWDTYNHCINA